MGQPRGPLSAILIPGQECTGEDGPSEVPDPEGFKGKNNTLNWALEQNHPPDILSLAVDDLWHGSVELVISHRGIQGHNGV